MKKLSISLLLISAITFVGCNKITQEVPDDVFTEDKAIKTEKDVENLLNSCYDAMANQLNGRTQTFNDLMSDDIVLTISDAGNKQEIYNRSTIIFNDDTRALYNSLYVVCFRINSMDQYYDKVGVSAANRSLWSAEGKFLRALAHFEIAKLWSQPPGFTPDNSHLGIIIRDKVSQLAGQRSTCKQTYDFIIGDLQYAIDNLPADNEDRGSMTKALANKNAAKALLAKVYFQLNRNSDALALLNDVIDNGGYIFNNTDAGLNRFNNPTTDNEVIFRTVSMNAQDNRGGVFTDQYRSDTKAPAYTLSKGLYTMLTADTSDKRGKTLVSIVNADKDNEYIAVKKFNRDFFGVPYLHLTDLILLRAQIRAELGIELAAAVADVNKIIERAYGVGSPRLLSPAVTQSALLTEVLNQRRMELFCEGDRLPSLKRRGAFYDNTLTIRNAPWNCPGMVLQFHAREGAPGFVFNGTGGCN